MRASLLGLTALASAAATAELQGQDATGRPANRDTSALPAVTVTATRSVSSILATPLAITKIMATELRNVSGFGIDEALRKVPGVDRAVALRHE